MDRFLLKILTIVVGFFLVGHGLQFLVDKGLQNTNDDPYHEWNRIYRGEIENDILILGNSRAKAQINPADLQEQTNLSAYNVGHDGLQLYEQRAKLNFIRRNTDTRPKLIIQNVDLFSFGLRKELAGKRQYLPYLSDRMLCQDLQKIDKTLYLEQLLPMAKYRGGFSSMIPYGLKHVFITQSKQKGLNPNGFYVHDEVWIDSFRNFSNGYKRLKSKVNFDFALGFTLLEQLLIESKQMGTEVVLVHAPLYRGFQELIPNLDSLQFALSELAYKHDAAYWDYTDLKINEDSTMFYNPTHLNAKGAGVFSPLLAQNIADYLGDKSTSANFWQMPGTIVQAHDHHSK